MTGWLHSPAVVFTLMLPTHPSVTGCTSLTLLIVHLPLIALLSAITTISSTSTFRTILDLPNPCREKWLETMRRTFNPCKCDTAVSEDFDIAKMNHTLSHHGFCEAAGLLNDLSGKSALTLKLNSSVMQFQITPSTSSWNINPHS